MVAGLILVSAGFLLILLFRHDLSVAAVVVSFMVLELGVGVSQTISNDTIVASVPRGESPAPRLRFPRRPTNSALSSAPRRSAPSSPRSTASNVALPGGLSPEQDGRRP